MCGILAILPESGQWLVYALAAITILYVVVRPMMRRKKDPLIGVPRLTLSQQRNVERDMENLLVELSEMARQVTAQLQMRSAKLEELMRQADAKIEELRRLSGASARPAKPEVTPERAAEAPVERPPAAPTERPPTRAAPADGRYSEIYALADEGRSPQEIAQRLDRPRGEVELILALRMRS